MTSGTVDGIGVRITTASAESEIATDTLRNTYARLRCSHPYGKKCDPKRMAIAHGVHSADVVLNILARQRDPAPPANILTPAALTLRHAPIADCARYDNLRRTN